MLNEEQKEAVEHKKGPLLIIAGAGTGKTTVITERIKHLIGTGLAKPEEILALTFTEKSAVEMENRVDMALPYGTFGMWISTFHSFCDRILRSEALSIGLSPHYKLMTEAESFLLVKKNFWKFNLNVFRPVGNPYKFIEGMLQHFSRLKDEDVSVEEYLRHSGARRAMSKLAASPLESKKEDAIASLQHDECIELANAYKTYEELKIENNVMDFSDLISNTLKLFRTRKNVLERYQKQFKYILVDEFQDTNFSQNELVKLLAKDDGNLTVVADDDQSIYRFRGAAVSNVLQFKKEFLKTKTVVLTKNYRSTQEILDRSYDLIQHNNPDRLEVQEKIDKRLVASGKRIGGKIELIYTDRVEDEAEEVVKIIKGPNYKDYAILVRANNHSEPFVRALERAGIPFQFLGPGMLFRQPEVKDMIAYLKVLYDFTDTVSLYRVLSMDIFGFSQRDLIEILNKAKKINVSLFEMMEEIIGHSGGRRPIESTEDKKMLSLRSSMTKFVEMVHRHQELMAKESAGQILYFFLEDSGLLKKVVEYKTVADEKRALNITKFFDKLKSLEGTNIDSGVFAVVDYLDLAMDMGESPLATQTDWNENNSVNILTLHSAKGLEFPVVFLVNLIEGRFPTRERKEQIPIPPELIKEILPKGDFHLEEERRLFYVGMTRAKEKLYFSAANFYGEGKRERKLSPFIFEAGVEKVKKQDTKIQLPLLKWEKSLTANPYPLTAIKIDYLSYSAIETFNICPLHYKLRVILKIPTPLTSSQALGNSMHMVLNELYTQKNDPLKSLKDNWIMEGYKDKKHEQESFEKAKNFLTQYLKSDLHKKANPIYLEKEFTFNLSGHSGARRAMSKLAASPLESKKEDAIASLQHDESVLKIGGKIDRIDDLGNGEVEIIDYKTGAKIPSQKEIDQNLQMTIYAIAASEILQKPIEKIKLSFYFFGGTSKISTVRTKEQLEEAKKELLAIRDEIEKSDFQCSGHLLCENCEFKMLCNG